VTLSDSYHCETIAVMLVDTVPLFTEICTYKALLLDIIKVPSLYFYVPFEGVN
jgi:hypothetical protein